MIEAAGGENLISTEKMPSRKMKLEEIQEVNPDIIVMMPCGFDVKRTISEYNSVLAENPDWNELKAVKENNVYAVDANSYFSKPVADGLILKERGQYTCGKCSSVIGEYRVFEQG